MGLRTYAQRSRKMLSHYGVLAPVGKVLRCIFPILLGVKVSIIF